MSFNGTMIYCEHGVDPKIGVSFRDVQRALGTSMHFLHELCTHGNINMWAKFRPVEFKSRGTQGDRYLKEVPDKSNGTTIIYGRDSVNYGIGNIPIWTNKTIANVANYWISRNTDGQNLPDDGNKAEWWTIVLPTSAFRLTDFVSISDPENKGYFPGAEAPIGSLISIDGQQNGTVTALYAMGLAGVTSGLTVTFSDLSSIRSSYQNYYFGIIIKAGNSVYLATQKNKVGNIYSHYGDTLWEQGTHVRFKIGTTSGALSDCARDNTTFKIFPVLSSQKNCYQTENGDGTTTTTEIQPMNNQSGVFIALYEAQDASFGIPTIEGSIGVLAAWKANANAIDIYFVFSVTNSNPNGDQSNSFTATLKILDANGNILNNNGNIFNINNLSGGKTWNSTATNIMNNEPTPRYIRVQNAGAAFVQLDVAVNGLDTSVYHRDTTATARITIGASVEG